MRAWFVKRGVDGGVFILLVKLLSVIVDFEFIGIL